MTISPEEQQVVIGALDTMAVLLAGYDHEWTEGERAIYEQAYAIISGTTPIEHETHGVDDDNEGEGWKQ